jgi:AraC-like DNA-binding protein
MNPSPLVMPSVPVSYVWLLLDLCADFGVSSDALLMGLDLPERTLNDTDGRVSLRPTYAALCRRALALTGEPGLGYEFGLRAALTSHGIAGLGLMSQPTLRQVLTFGLQFASVLRLSAWDLHVDMGVDPIRMWAVESVPPNDIRHFSAQMLVVSACTLLCQLLPACRQSLVLSFDFPEPEYHAKYASHLPTCRFGAPFNEIRLPAYFLDTPLQTANPVAAKLAERECAQELSLTEVTRHDDIVRQVRGLLTLSDNGYPTPADLAKKLHLSVRTLARQLQVQGCSYRSLLQDARHRDSRVLLQNERLSISQVAQTLGYGATAAFSRAFQGWYGMPPSAYRAGPANKQA